MNTIRYEKFVQNGIPKYIRVYDNGGLGVEGGTFDRYTVVYTGKYRGKGCFQYVGMSEYPFSASGFGQHGESETQIDAPKGWAPAIGRKNHLGIRVTFDKLPDDCQKLVMEDYIDIWNLNGIRELA